MFQAIQRLYKKPTADAIAIDTLQEAQRQLLTHQASETYHAKMGEYYKETINRLTIYLKNKGN